MNALIIAIDGPSAAGKSTLAKRLARDLGAALSLTGTVQKVSNLILNINMVVRDVATGKVVAAGSADIRSNSDASWFKGVDWLLRHRIAQQLANRQP